MKALFIIFTIAALLAFGTAVAAGVLYPKRKQDEKHGKAYRICSIVAVFLIAIAAACYIGLGGEIFR